MKLHLGRWGENWVEAKYRGLFQSMDLSRDFYFSHTYDLTNTLQANMGAPTPGSASAAAAAGAGGSPSTSPTPCEAAAESSAKADATSE